MTDPNHVDAAIAPPERGYAALADARALVTPDAVARALEAEAEGVPLLLDVRWTLAGADRDGYLGGHLPGAVFCDLDADLADPPGDGGRHPLPDAETLQQTFARLGVRAGRMVVVYDGGRGPGAGAGAARAWWCLRWVGHADVRVLDGGLAAWVDAGLPLEQGEVPPADPLVVEHGAETTVAVPGAQAPGAGASGGVASGDAVVADAFVPGMPTVSAAQVRAGLAGRLVDARAPERFRGETEPIDPVAGHIPGAVNLPVASVQGDDGRYLAADGLREVLAPVVGGAQVTAYCGSGVTAAQLVLAAYEVGETLSLYPGSWSDWIRDPDRPVATGA